MGLDCVITLQLGQQNETLPPAPKESMHNQQPNYMFTKQTIKEGTLTLTFFETGSCSVTEAEVQRHSHSSLQPQTPLFKQFSHLGHLNRWDYRCKPLLLANFL